MRHTWSLEQVFLQDSWVTIGSFDGVHRGHQEIIHCLTTGAHLAGAAAVVVTFYPHPAAVLRHRHPPLYLTSPEERAQLLGEMGVDIVITHPFNREVANLSADEFMRRLKKHLNMSHLWVGHDFALGRGRSGDVPALIELGKEMEYTTHHLDPVRVDDQLVSSSEIRAALAKGDVTLANRLLGRPYQISGFVVHGDARGRKLGIPTANLDIWAERVIPKEGVYVSQAHIDGVSWGAVTNVGRRPTFETHAVPPRVETHILEFKNDLYGQEITLSFIERLRDEMRFPSTEHLMEQIHEDIKQARQRL